MSHGSGLFSKWSVHHRALSRRSLLQRLSTSAQASAGSLPPRFSSLPSPQCFRSLLTGTCREDNDTRYPSSAPPSFEISEYLLSGCSWNRAPSLPEFVGPVSIKATDDCRGRGLFTSADVGAGDILLVSSPYALSYNDHNSMQLYRMISSLAKESPKAFCQIASLAGYCDELMVPPMEIFYPNSLHCKPPEGLEIDAQRIINVMNANCFGGAVKLSDSEPATQLNGLWLLPSFINHSCTPNASRLFVGKALVILASRHIPANKEITISYTDCFLPVHMRDEQLETLACGFFCECQRCIAERSLQDHLLDVSESFQVLHDEAVDEVFSLVNGKCGRPARLSASAELLKLFDTLSKKLESCVFVTSAQKQWIQASYSYAFLANAFADYLSGAQKSSLCVSSKALELVHSMKCTAPGMLRTLSFVMLLTTAVKQQGSNSELIKKLDTLAREECIQIYGNQSLTVTYKLMERSLDAIPYV